MSKKLIVIIIAAVIAAGLVVFAQTNKGSAPANDSSHNAADMPASSENTSTSTPTPTTEQTSASDKVTIADFAYGPKTVTVKKGTTVTWTNNDVTRHDVTPDKPTSEFKASELLSKGQSYSVTFNTPGSYSYHCSPHPEMQGTVIVTE